MNLLLSILTPAVPSRFLALQGLCQYIDLQISQSCPVEHLVLIDNKRRTVGEKRDALLRAARGKYVAFVDDDDWISDTYVADLLAAAEADPDVITFLQECTVNGQTFEVEFHLGNPNEAPPRVAPASRGSHGSLPVIKRNAWHVCAWRRALAICSSFPPVNYGEDWAFAARLCGLPNLRSIHIPKILHYYRHDSSTTEAAPPRRDFPAIAENETIPFSIPG